MHNVRRQPALLICMSIALQVIAFPTFIAVLGQWRRVVRVVLANCALLAPARALQSEDA
jgi:hypothetical protein